MDEKQPESNPGGNTKIPLIVGIALLALVAAAAYFIPFPSSWQKGILLTVLALAAAGIAAIIPGFIEIEHKGLLRAGGAIAVFCVVYFFKPQTSAADLQDFDLTVFVHGPKGRQDIILKNTGHLILDFDDDRRMPMIGEGGRTVFSGIPGKIRENGARTTIGLDAPGYELVEPEKEYPITETPVYIAVRKVETPQTPPGTTGTKPEPPAPKAKPCIVFGLIKDKTTDQVVANAQVSLLCGSIFRAKSGADGSFSLELPATFQNDRCLIRAEFGKKSKEIFIPLCDPNPVELKLE